MKLNDLQRFEVKHYDVIDTPKGSFPIKKTTIMVRLVDVVKLLESMKDE